MFLPLSQKGQINPAPTAGVTGQGNLYGEGRHLQLWSGAVGDMCRGSPHWQATQAPQVCSPCICSCCFGLIVRHHPPTFVQHAAADAQHAKFAASTFKCVFQFCWLFCISVACIHFLSFNCTQASIECIIVKVPQLWSDGNVCSWQVLWSCHLSFCHSSIEPFARADWCFCHVTGCHRNALRLQLTWLSSAYMRTQRSDHQLARL